MVRVLGLIFGIVLLALAGHSLQDALYGPERVILKFGTVTLRSESSPAKNIIRRTRQVRRGDDIYWEVEMKSGSWLDCAKDCAETYRREEVDLWETKKQETIK